MKDNIIYEPFNTLDEQQKAEEKIKEECDRLADETDEKTVIKEIEKQKNRIEARLEHKQIDLNGEEKYEKN